MLDLSQKPKSCQQDRDVLLHPRSNRNVRTMKLKPVSRLCSHPPPGNSQHHPTRGSSSPSCSASSVSPRYHESSTGVNVNPIDSSLSVHIAITIIPRWRIVRGSKAISNASWSMLVRICIFSIYGVAALAYVLPVHIITSNLTPLILCH